MCSRSIGKIIREIGNQILVYLALKTPFENTYIEVSGWFVDA
jgi:hypothetical protein